MGKADLVARESNSLQYSVAVNRLKRKNELCALCEKLCGLVVKNKTMKIIVPMAGRGSRLRPHTLTIPKPLIPIAGKPIVHRLVEDIAVVLNQNIDEVAFIIHESFVKKVE